MSGLIPEDRIREVLDAVDIVELIGREVELRGSGADFWGLCPFHEEDTPSFHVRAEVGSYHCFGCKAGGTAITWVMERLGLTFPEATRMLAEEHGIRLEENPERAGSATSGGRARILDALAWATEFFHRRLGSPGARAAREYLTHRGFRREVVLRFKLGYASASWDALLNAGRGEGFADEVLEAAGLVVRRDEGARCFDMFRDRLVFPIMDVAGRPVGFGARILGDGEPKYLNSPDGPLFNKRRTLFGLDQAKAEIRRRKQVVLVEGYTDVIMAHQVGRANVVAGLGTAFTADHARLLRRFTETVVLLYDGDTAGRSAAERAFGTCLEQELDIRVALLEGGRDPCEIAVAEGPEGLDHEIEAANDAVAHLMESIRRGGDGPQARAAAVKKAREIVQRVPDPIRRELLTRAILDGAGIHGRESKERLHRDTRPRPARRAASSEAPEEPESEPQAELWALESALVDPEHRMGGLAEAPLGSGAVRRIAGRAVGLLGDGRYDLALLLTGLTEREQSLVTGLVASGEKKNDHERQFLDSLRRIRKEAAPDPRNLLKDAMGRGDQEAVRRLISQIRGRSEREDDAKEASGS